MPIPHGESPRRERYKSLLGTISGIFACVALVACGPSTDVHEPPAGKPSMSSVGPLNIAHRGASAYAPEHTLAAYQLAIDMGADFVEQDLQLTRDGVLVCLHDAGLERTTDVEQLFPDRAVELEVRGEMRKTWPVLDFSLAEIRQLDAGSWFGADFAGARVPSFQEAIDLVRGRAGIYPEIKDPDGYETLGFEMEAKLARVLADNGLDSVEAQASTPVFIQSFSADSLKRMRAQTGSVYRLIQLVRRAQADSLMTDTGLAVVADYATGVGPSLPILLSDPSRAAAARRVGLEIHPYTVRANDLPTGFSDASSLMSYLIDEIGATGVFTDNPDLFPASK